jgi:hypothetical protein
MGRDLEAGGDRFSRRLRPARGCVWPAPGGADGFVVGGEPVQLAPQRPQGCRGGVGRPLLRGLVEPLDLPQVCGW